MDNKINMSATYRSPTHSPAPSLTLFLLLLLLYNQSLSSFHIPWGCEWMCVCARARVCVAIVGCVCSWLQQASSIQKLALPSTPPILHPLVLTFFLPSLVWRFLSLKGSDIDVPSAPDDSILTDSILFSLSSCINHYHPPQKEASLATAESSTGLWI